MINARAETVSTAPAFKKENDSPDLLEANYADIALGCAVGVDKDLRSCRVCHTSNSVLIF
jgi:hypothetical protein